MNVHTLTIVVSVVIFGSATLYVIGELRAFIGRRKRARSAQSFVSMLRQVNEGLAEQGKHVPERVAMDIIKQESE